MLQLLFLVSSYVIKIASVAKYKLHETDYMTTVNNNDVTQCSKIMNDVRMCTFFVIQLYDFPTS